MDEALKPLGMFCLLTNQSDLPPGLAPQIYQRRDFIEKAFDSEKNESENDRMFT